MAWPPRIFNAGPRLCIIIINHLFGIVNGQMMNYKRYYESLKNTPEPDDVRNPVAIDYKALIAYAEERNLEPC